ncbi:MAG: PilZ domain-containing protein [Gammaproteobacteria bacterium]|nr:PilZ domain-containing protein [Gammaproteobacteria bacterium]
MMFSNNDMSNLDERRAFDRIGICRSVRLTLDDGTATVGDTNNISLSGIKISTRDAIATNSGQAAILQIYLGDKRFSPEYGGTIIRNEDNSVCMTLNSDRRISFAIFLTKNIFSVKKTFLPLKHIKSIVG